MADSSSREKKLAAGLKKFKQFQQKSGKKVPKKENESSSATVTKSAFQTTDLSPLRQVPSLSQKHSDDLEQSLIRKEESEKPALESRSLDSSPKSQSDLNLNFVKELSSSESLRQISLQVNGLMSETNAFVNGDAIEKGEESEESLEKRNQELAQLVSSLRQSNDQLQFLLQEQKSREKRLSANFDRERQELQEKSHKEQVSLKDQLQVHIQTIGILVAEKTELQSSLSLSQQTAKQKAGEVEELQGRLRASRQRASDLERELISVTNSNQQLEKAKAELSKEVEKLKQDSYKLSKANEDLKMSNSELSEKLNRKISEIREMEKELSGLRSRSTTPPPPTSAPQPCDCSAQLEDVYQQKIELEKRLQLQKESVDKLMSERDQMSEQYQLHIQQLSQQVTSLRDEVKQLTSEKEALSKEKNCLEETIEKDTVKASCDPLVFRLQIDELTRQNEAITRSMELQKSKFEDLLQEKEEVITELEKRVCRYEEDRVDNTRLYERMQSDKVAASRAVAQNRELKKQIEELHGSFLSMSNDKLELTEKLHSEQCITKELGERLSQQEEELLELKTQLLKKEEELASVQNFSTKGVYQQKQIADRMRHYEAQGQLVEMLQKELHQAQEQINELTVQNSELRMAVATHAEVAVSDELEKDSKESSKRNDLVASLSASVRQLEMERNQLMKQLEEQKVSRSNLEEHLKKKKTQINQDLNGNNDAVSKEEYDMMKKAMEQLEERFKHTMNRIAELSDERQQLEHLVMQLQGETDTIGDYIALYQIQRSLMHKRASEKDEYIAQLARDREDMKAKLGELQSLVLRLLEERKLYQGANVQDDLSVKSVHLVSKEDAPDENGVSKEESEEVEPEKKAATAKKIIDLLTEIETTNLVEKPVLENFHPCPVCSGRLIVV